MSCRYIFGYLAACAAALASLLLLAACASSSATAIAGAGCPPGQVESGGSCVPLCSSGSDCAAGEVCIDSACGPVTAGETPPRITGINGDGSTDGTAGQAANHIASGVVLTGENLHHTELGFAVTLIDSAGGTTDLSSMVVSSAADQLALTFPTSLVSGETYVLRVVNQFGADQTTITVLQGEPGQNGAAGNNGVCTANCGNAVPGVTRSTFIEVRGVNSAHASAPTATVSITTGAGDVLANHASGTIAQGYVAAFFDRTSENEAGHTASDEVSTSSGFFDRDTLTAHLTGLTSKTITVIASWGDTNVGAGDLAALKTQLKALGAPAEIDALGAGDAFALVGHKGLGAGNAIFVRADPTHGLRDFDADNTPDGTVAEAGVVVYNDRIVGTPNGSRTQFGSTVAVVGGGINVDGNSDGTSVNVTETGGVLSIGSGFTVAGTSGSTTVGALNIDGDGGGAVAISEASGVLTLDGDGGGGVTLGEASGVFALDGTTLAVDAANDRVGVGTTTPTETLHVNGILRATTATKFGAGTVAKSVGALAAGNVLLDNGSADSPGLHFYIADNENWGIDAAGDGLRIVEDLDEAGPTIHMNVNTDGRLDVNSGALKLGPLTIQVFQQDFTDVTNSAQVMTGPVQRAFRYFVSVLDPQGNRCSFETGYTIDQGNAGQYPIRDTLTGAATGTGCKTSQPNGIGVNTNFYADAPSTGVIRYFTIEFEPNIRIFTPICNDCTPVGTMTGTTSLTVVQWTLD